MDRKVPDVFDVFGIGKSTKITFILNPSQNRNGVESFNFCYNLFASHRFYNVSMINKVMDLLTLSILLLFDV